MADLAETYTENTNTQNDLPYEGFEEPKNPVVEQVVLGLF